MATTRIMPLHIGKGRTESTAISDIIDYVANPQKTDNGRLVTGYECDSRIADTEFVMAKRQYIATTGRVRGKDDVIAYHVRQSFRPGEITPEEANRLGVEFAKRFTKGNHAFIVCTHIDKAHVHNHIIWSSVNLDCDRKFRNFWGSTKAVRRLSDTICIENGLSIIENPNPHGKSYNKWLGDKAKPSHREQLRMMIDQALEQKPTDFDALLKMLSEMGCEVTRRGKAIRLKAPGWKNIARMDEGLGTGYSEAEIRAVLAGKKQHTPRKKSTIQAEPPKVNLLVDIQEKLRAGKGAGYARWAKVFNLKQMAQTMNFLTEHNLLEYAVLEEKAASATAHHNELSAQIKAAEKRMAEIAVLRTHIINYAKTREIYVAYLCGGGCRTLFPWGDGLDHKMKLHHFESEEDQGKPYNMEQARTKRLTDEKGRTRSFGIQQAQNVWGRKMRCRCGSPMLRHRWRTNNAGKPIYGYECKRHHDTPRIRLQNEQGNPTPICEIKPVGQSKLELMASKIFERVWGDQREIVLQTCKMLDACYKPDADRRADLMKAKDDSIQLLQQQLDDLVVVRARGEIEQDKFLQRTIEIQQQMEALRQSKAQIASEDYNPGRLDMEAIEAALCEAVEMHDGLVSEDFIDLFVSQVTPLSDSRFAWCLDFSPQPTVAFLNLAGQRKYTTCSMDSKLHFGPFADEEGHTIPFPGSLRR